ncbi:MAG: sigma-54 dependent transcriptional regulator [Pseudomonadota bacterium]
MSKNGHNILVVDDHPDVVAALKLLFKGEDYQVTAGHSPAEALQLAARKNYDAALIDLNYSEDTTSGSEGLRLLKDLHELNPDLPVVVMTAWGSVAIAVQAMQEGAGDFVEKPWDNQRLLSIIRNQIALGGSRRREQRLAAENALLRDADGQPFIARSAAMQPVLAIIDRVAASAANVLITGEHGTGKSLLAREIHRRSDRADKTLVTVNIGGLADTVFESEIFGHVRGAFTDAQADRVGRFEMADGGTLFLDEITNIPLVQQSKLLRVLEEGELERVGSSRTLTVDVRVISATNSDEKLADPDQFRPDLLFRLNTVEIKLPPLRQRADDIEPMCELFLAQTRARYGSAPAAFSPAALTTLKGHHWPGNIRELSHVVERAVLMATEEVIQPTDLSLPAGAAPSHDFEALPLEQAEKLLIQAALARNKHNVLEAARELGLSRSALYRRLEKHGLKDIEGS